MLEQGLLLSRQWRDTDEGLELSYWFATNDGPKKLTYTDEQVVCFVAQQDVPKLQNTLDSNLQQSVQFKSLALKSFDGQPQSAVYINKQSDLFRLKDIANKHLITLFEADIGPQHRFLMERFITAFAEFPKSEQNLNLPIRKGERFIPSLTIASLDIETAIYSEQIYSIAITGERWPTADARHEIVFVVAQEQPVNAANVVFCENELSLLVAFIEYWQRLDADAVIGWAVINFDLRYIQRRCDHYDIEFAFGREAAPIKWRQSRDDEDFYTAFIPGRMALDGISVLKSAMWQFESYSLESVSRELLGKGKKIDHVDQRGAEITRLYEQDLDAFLNYNLEDCRLVEQIFQHCDLMNFVIEKAEMTGLTIDRFGGSVAAFEYRYLPLLHRQGFIAPNLPIDPEGVGSPGGYVFDSTPGIYRHVVVLDFKSLYPSIIRSFNVDPLALAKAELEHGIVKTRNLTSHDEIDLEQLSPGFNGAAFVKEAAILPSLIEELWQQRDMAKAQQNASMSQAIKILMNSFYGVLGTPGCRFFDYRLPSSITLRGHQILTLSKQWIELNGHKVIYGDTDSVFVHINTSDEQVEQIAKGLEVGLNQWWRIYLQQQYQLESALEIEFEGHYEQFVMPTIRGSEKGSKKRYAGLTEKGEWVFKGLEAVRSDWTPFARQFQRDLYAKIFSEQDWQSWLQQLLLDLRAGQYDEQLVYRKRLRKPVEEYQKNVPPHVQAAKMALQMPDFTRKLRKGSQIEYVLTKNGPQEITVVQSALDYEAYTERQVKPIVDGIAHFLSTSFEQINNRQMPLFN